MDIESVWLFVFVVEKFNISVVGWVLGMVLVVVSVKLVKFEKILGVDLLCRFICKVVLFLEGVDFLFYVREIFV